MDCLTVKRKRIMKVNKKFVQEVADGKYRDYDTHGEMQRAAQCILDEKLVSKFSSFCFRIYGKELPDNVGDIFDAFVDFSIHGAEIKFEVPQELYPVRLVQVFGYKAESSLKSLYRAWCECSNRKLQDFILQVKFRIKGEKGMFQLNPCALHHVFDNGFYPESKALEWCRV